MSRSSGKVLVMLNSRPLFNLADASVNWNLIPVPLDRIERIEIVRGPGSVLYGENAFFGTINIITSKDPADSAGVYVGGGEGKSMIAGKTTVYVCENFACKRPVNDPVALKAMLESVR